MPLSRAEAMRLYPRIPTLRAHRAISKGEEILFNYGSSLPFCPKGQQPGAATGVVDDFEIPAEETAASRGGSRDSAAVLALSMDCTDLDWLAHGLDAGKLRAVLEDLRAANGTSGKGGNYVDQHDKALKVRQYPKMPRGGPKMATPP